MTAPKATDVSDLLFRNVAGHFTAQRRLRAGTETGGAVAEQHLLARVGQVYPALALGLGEPGVGGDGIAFEGNTANSLQVAFIDVINHVAIAGPVTFAFGAVLAANGMAFGIWPAVPGFVLMAFAAGGAILSGATDEFRAFAEPGFSPRTVRVAQFLTRAPSEWKRPRRNSAGWSATISRCRCESALGDSP